MDEGVGACKSSVTGGADLHKGVTYSSMLRDVVASMKKRGSRISEPATGHYPLPTRAFVLSKDAINVDSVAENDDAYTLSFRALQNDEFDVPGGSVFDGSQVTGLHNHADSSNSTGYTGLSSLLFGSVSTKVT
nr:hypothetical protein [Tanacetum cinerariifolium]